MVPKFINSVHEISSLSDIYPLICYKSSLTYDIKTDKYLFELCIFYVYMIIIAAFKVISQVCNSRTLS